jgi:NitT/TauT family transport system ATP-binding protein
MSLVSFRDVQKSYRSLQGAEYVAVEHFSLDIEAGEFFCLLGPIGCGKTTVLKMLAGFEGPTAGQIVMEGRPVTAASRDRGVVFQGDDSLYGWLTAVENVEFGLRMGGVARAGGVTAPCVTRRSWVRRASSRSIRRSCQVA